MSIQIKGKCPNCNRLVKFTQSNFRSVGIPLITCPYCKSLVRNPRVNEWRTMDDKEKFAYFGVYILTTLLWQFCATFFVVLFLYFVLGMPDRSFWLKATVPVGIIAAAVFISITHKEVEGQIRESERRLQNPDYIYLLLRAGLIKKKE